MLRILHDTKVDFIRWWRVVAVVIAIFLLPGLLWIGSGMLPGGAKPFNLGIEFTSGTFVRYKFAEAPDIGDIRQIVATAGFPSAEVQTFGSPTEIAIRAQTDTTAGSTDAAVSRIGDGLRARYPGVETLQTEVISPRVGDELTKNAVIAMLISFVVTLVYLAWRFDARLGLAAILANMHDILATFAFIKYLQIEMTLFVVGGILTVIGYSLADKVVVFDRVRELLRKGARRPLTETLNLAINQTLPRTVMTGSTVIACLLALIFLGGDVLRPFALVLLFGIVIGTFSSIYVASPLLLLIERKWPRHDGETKGMSRALSEERKRERKQPVAAGKE